MITKMTNTTYHDHRRSTMCQLVSKMTISHDHKLTLKKFTTYYLLRWTVCLSLSTTLSLWSIIRPLIFSLCRWYHDNHVLRWTVCPFLGRSPPYSQGWLAFISRFNFFLPLYPGFIFCCLYISSFDFLLAFTSRFFFLAFISRFDFFLAIISRFNFLP